MSEVPGQAAMSGHRRAMLSVLWEAVVRWIDHGAPNRGAAFAFYSLTSQAPVSLLLVWIGALAGERGEKPVAGFLRRRLLSLLLVSSLGIVLTVSMATRVVT